MIALSATLLAAQKDADRTWAATTAYVLNTTSVTSSIIPTVENGRHYICTTAGTSGSTEPTWPSTTGVTVNDGTVVWTDNGKRGDVLCKIVLTRTGQDTQTYGVDTTNRLLHVSHTEQYYSGTANVVVDNREGNLTALPLQGYQGVLSYGYITSGGNEYAATAPLVVKAQEIYSTGGELICALRLYGLLDQLNEDEASCPFALAYDTTSTVKDLITLILSGGLTDELGRQPYSHCTGYTPTYDSEDGLLDSFKVADYLTINKGETRLAVIRRLLGYTKCVIRPEDDGNLHILNPTVSGSTYNYEYNDTINSVGHTFFSKTLRERLVTPNVIVVDSAEDHAAIYHGSAVSAASYALFARWHFITARLASDSEADDIAAAIIQRLELDQSGGSGYAPMNVGQEVHDYIKMTDTRQADTRTGNIAYLTRTYEPGKFDFTFGFGKPMVQMPLMLRYEPPEDYVTHAYFREWIEQYYYPNLFLIDRRFDEMDMRIGSINTNAYSGLAVLPTEEMTLKRLTVTDRLTIPYQ